MKHYLFCVGILLGTLIGITGMFFDPIKELNDLLIVWLMYGTLILLHIILIVVENKK